MYYIYIDLAYIRFVLIQALELLLNYYLLLFENLFFNFKFVSKKYTSSLVLNNTKSILIYS
jgi:hypothetical protein